MKFRIIASIIVVIVLFLIAIVINMAKNEPSLDADGQSIPTEQN
jgi:hypothetical protein